jgi:hypothetical protein
MHVQGTQLDAPALLVVPAGHKPALTPKAQLLLIQTQFCQVLGQ